MEFVVGILAEGWTTEQAHVANYPQLTAEDICRKASGWHYAAEVLKHERVFPLPV